MEVFETVRTVLAVREYRTDPVPAEAVQRVIEAGRVSGSAMNKQPWHFIVVDDPAVIQQLAGLAKSGPYLANAPVAIVVAIDDTRWAESDTSRAIQSMILTAWSEGLGSNWVGFYGLEPVNGVLGIPDEKKVLAILPLGYPVDPIGKGEKKRKPLGEIASRNRYGEPYA